jgi:neutral ceramidase
MFRQYAAAVVFVAALLCPLVVSAEQYFVGIGRADVTGPAADVNLMGYAVLNQTAKGIHTRQYARAYVFADSAMQ